MGYQNFTAGLAPNEADWDTNIGEQVVMRFADAAARDAALAPPPSFGIRCVTMDDRVEWIFEDDGFGGLWTPFGRYGVWDISHVPTLTATTTNPTLGTGPVLECRWTREGTLATVAYYVALGTSGSAPGVGVYEISLPPECPAAAAWFGAQEYVAGNGVAIDVSTGTRRTVAVTIVGASTIRLESDGLGGPVTESNLIAWGDGDIVLSGVITYETEEV